MNHTNHSKKVDLWENDAQGELFPRERDRNGSTNDLPSSSSGVQSPPGFNAGHTHAAEARDHDHEAVVSPSKRRREKRQSSAVARPVDVTLTVRVMFAWILRAADIKVPAEVAGMFPKVPVRTVENIVTEETLASQLADTEHDLDVLEKRFEGLETGRPSEDADKPVFWGRYWQAWGALIGMVGVMAASGMVTASNVQRNSTDGSIAMAIGLSIGVAILGMVLEGVFRGPSRRLREIVELSLGPVAIIGGGLMIYELTDKFFFYDRQSFEAAPAFTMNAAAQPAAAKPAKVSLGSLFCGVVATECCAVFLCWGQFLTQVERARRPKNYRIDEEQEKLAPRIETLRKRRTHLSAQLSGRMYEKELWESPNPVFRQIGKHFKR